VDQRHCLYLNEIWQALSKDCGPVLLLAQASVFCN
jgi:hypothetical protein